jgi:hypothetical protein
MVAAGEGGILTWDAATFQNFRMEAWIRVPDADTLANCQGGFVFAWADNNNYYQLKLYDNGATERFQIREVTAGAGADRTTTAFTVAAATWYKVTAIVYLVGASLQIKGYINDILITSYLDASPRATPNRVGIWCASTIASRVWADTFRVSKYVDPEPVLSSWYSQESYYDAYGITSLTHLAAGMAKGDILVSEGTVLAVSTPGPVGTELTSGGPGVLPTWAYPP